MTEIAELALPGDLNISLLYDKGQLAYTFEFQEKTFGNKVKLPSRKLLDIASTCLILFTNALETKQSLDEGHVPK